MTLKLMKILLSLIVMNPLKEMVRPQTIWNIILSFCIKILQKSCKYWKQLQKVFVSNVKNYIAGIVSTLQVLKSDSKRRLHICYCIQRQMCNGFFESDYSATSKFASWIALQKAPFKKQTLNFHFHFWAYIFCMKWK